MKKSFSFLSLLILLFVSFSCTKDDLEVPTELEINNFVWKGMNQYYLWQGDVPNLADNRFASQSHLNDFLRGYSDPTVLFNNLRVDTSIDRFSVIFSDYTVLEYCRVIRSTMALIMAYDTKPEVQLIFLVGFATYCPTLMHLEKTFNVAIFFMP
jgi:hypothetical protein